MPERSRQSISIAADPAAIMAVIADFEDYPQWARQVKTAVVTKPGRAGRPQRVKMSVDAGVFKDTYELEYTWSGDDAVSWTLVEGEMQKSQDGKYTLEAVDTGDGPVTEVTYELTVDLAIPMLGMLKRKAEKVIMDTALKELKKRVESTG